MTIKTILDNEHFVAGITLKDDRYPEQHNMALHACSDPEAVLSNRRRLADFLDTELGHFICPEQVHSANVKKVSQEDAGRGALSADDAIPGTDALYTTDSDVLLCSFSADCVPVVFWEEASGVAGVVHSGWQGTVKEITPRTFSEIRQTERADLSRFHVWIGPAISQEKFEVDADVEQRFRQLGYADEWIAFNEATGKYHIDNQQVVKKQCERAGIPAANITVEPFCTYENTAGFSHRQDKRSGRHLAFILKKV